VHINRLFVLVLAALTVTVFPLLAQDAAPEPSGALRLDVLSTYQTGVFDEGAAEIAAYDPSTQQVFVVNGDSDTIDVFSIADPAAIERVAQIDVTEYGDGANSVDVYNGVLAIAVEGEAVDENGRVVFLATADRSFLASVEVGVLPDMVTFTPDGARVLTANEGEPSDDYSIDPEGSVSIIDVSGGFADLTQDKVITVGFAAFNAGGPRAAELPADVRIYGPNATVAQDLEPEYIAVSPDSATAYVTLQEANAIAVIDLAAGEVVEIRALGFKDHSQPGNELDATKDDEQIRITNWPVFGMYQPDGIAAFAINGTVYYLTANEGDTRDYDGYSEETEVAETPLDPTVFPNAAELQSEETIGGLENVSSTGDSDGDGDFDGIYIPGGRSFSIYTADGALVYESGALLERITAAAYPEHFNAANDDHGLDDRSDNKGPEPEGVAIGVIDGVTYAFIGLEQIGGIVVFDISDPTAPVFVTYVNNRDFSGDIEAGQAGDLGPEGLEFIPADVSPNGMNLLVVANEVSGSTTIYQITPGM
jgi:hypothetical protein